MNDQAIILGDLIYDVYVNVDKVAPNQEFPSTFKSYLYYLDYKSLFNANNDKVKIIPGGAANYFVNKRVKSKFITPIFNQYVESLLISLSKLDSNPNLITIEVPDSNVVNPVKIRFTKGNEILFRFDIEPDKGYCLDNNQTLTERYLKFFQKAQSIEVVDYDKLFAKTLNFDYLKANVSNSISNKLKFVFLMVKPNLLDRYLDSLVKPLIASNKLNPENVYIQLNEFEYKEYGKEYTELGNFVITLGSKGFKLISVNGNVEKHFEIPKQYRLSDKHNFSGAGDFFGAALTDYLSAYNANELFENTNLIEELFKIVSDKIKNR